MEQIWNRIKEQPAIVVQAVQVVLGLLVAFQLFELSDDQTGAILTFVAASTGLILAMSVRPFRWPAATGFVQAAVVAVTAFGIELSSEQVASIYAATAVLGAILVRQAVTPETKLPPVLTR